MSGWRKRQVTDMARESWLDVYGLGHDRQSFIKSLEAFAELVREDEREACAMVCEEEQGYKTAFCALKIRARGQA